MFNNFRDFGRRPKFGLPDLGPIKGYRLSEGLKQLILSQYQPPQDLLDAMNKATQNWHVKGVVVPAPQQCQAVAEATIEMTMKDNQPEFTLEWWLHFNHPGFDVNFLGPFKEKDELHEKIEEAKKPFTIKPKLDEIVVIPNFVTLEKPGDPTCYEYFVCLSAEVEAIRAKQQKIQSDIFAKAKTISLEPE